MDKKIGMWGYVRNGPNDGFGYAGLKLVETFESLGITMKWEDKSAPIALSFKQPMDYGGVSGQYRIGYTPWESTVLPKEWREIINYFCDEFWTTSNFCADVFSNGGVALKPKVVHHGIDSTEWTLTKREKESDFIFLHQGEPADRKGGQIVFDAFREVFGGKENIHLLYKSVAWVEARWREGNKILGAVDSFPNVHITNGYLTQTQMDELYSKVHCLVYPSSGEGFGLIPFQAAATGMPAIAPIWGGVADFGEYLLPIEYTVGPSNHDYHLGEWCWPSTESVAQQMSDVYENYKTHSELAYERAERLRKEFSWEKILEPVVASLETHF